MAARVASDEAPPPSTPTTKTSKTTSSTPFVVPETTDDEAGEDEEEEEEEDVDSSMLNSANQSVSPLFDQDPRSMLGVGVPSGEEGRPRSTLEQSFYTFLTSMQQVMTAHQSNSHNAVY